MCPGFPHQRRRPSEPARQAIKAESERRRCRRCAYWSMGQLQAYILVLVSSLLVRNQAFVLRGAPAHVRFDMRTVLSMTAGDADKAKDDIKPTSEDPSLGIKAAWYGSELFGNIIGFGKSKGQAESGPESSADEAISRQDAVARLKTDFDRFYFVTGQMDLDLYEPDCVFADPFVAFEGRERFKNNLDNLGSLMQDVSLDVTSWEEEEASLKTKWRFRCVLGLPWKPSLAAAGGTEFFFNQDSGRIERHVESWEIEPIDALKQLIRPGRKKKPKSS